MSKKIRVGVLFGGQSGEHEVSLASARSVIEALEASGRYEVVPIGIARTGRWILHPKALAILSSRAEIRLGVDSQRAEIGPAAVPDEPTALVPDGERSSLVPLSGGAPERLDVVFPVLHGTKGEDGTVQGFLDLAGIPYVGCGVASSAVAMDKDLAKRLFRSAGLLVPDWILVRRTRWEREREGVLNEAERIGYPCFVKPANLGSSVGISKAKNRNELARAIDEAARYDVRILVEEAIVAREIEVSVLGNNDPEASLPGEVIPCNEFYDYNAKYIDGESELVIPALLSPEKTKEVRDSAIRAFRALDCAGMARVDFLLERTTDRLLLSEVNTIPGFTSISMYTKLWEASGLSYGALVDRLIELAFERHEERKGLLTSYRPPKQENGGA
ncbi:MAG: D-alanine--D-alanine ligase [Candidatus Eisenbacteria bacterium]|nr:D-alanine--D-alanine ligase [Candidatus Eisenbacteria bacterium]